MPSRSDSKKKVKAKTAAKKPVPKKSGAGKSKRAQGLPLPPSSSEVLFEGSWEATPKDHFPKGHEDRILEVINREMGVWGGIANLWAGGHVTFGDDSQKAFAKALCNGQIAISAITAIKEEAAGIAIYYRPHPDMKDLGWNDLKTYLTRYDLEENPMLWRRVRHCWDGLHPREPLPQFLVETSPNPIIANAKASFLPGLSEWTLDQRQRGVECAREVARILDDIRAYHSKPAILGPELSKRLAQLLDPTLDWGASQWEAEMIRLGMVYLELEAIPPSIWEQISPEGSDLKFGNRWHIASGSASAKRTLIDKGKAVARFKALRSRSNALLGRHSRPGGEEVSEDEAVESAIRVEEARARGIMSLAFHWHETRKRTPNGESSEQPAHLNATASDGGNSRRDLAIRMDITLGNYYWNGAIKQLLTFYWLYVIDDPAEIESVVSYLESASALQQGEKIVYGHLSEPGGIRVAGLWDIWLIDKNRDPKNFHKGPIIGERRAKIEYRMPRFMVNDPELDDNWYPFHGKEAEMTQEARSMLLGKTLQQFSPHAYGGFPSKIEDNLVRMDGTPLHRRPHGQSIMLISHNFDLFYDRHKGKLEAIELSHYTAKSNGELHFKDQPLSSVRPRYRIPLADDITPSLAREKGLDFVLRGNSESESASMPKVESRTDSSPSAIDPDASSGVRKRLGRPLKITTEIIEAVRELVAKGRPDEEIARTIGNRQLLQTDGRTKYKPTGDSIKTIRVTHLKS